MPLNLNQLPDNLPVPLDDGAADHLWGLTLPKISLQSTQGKLIPTGDIAGRVVLYCYPMTGQPGVPLPDGWDEIPGARGCTPQTCAFRDHFQDLQSLGAEAIGMSVQSTEYQREMAERLHLPFPVVSDIDYQFQKALNLPTFVTAGMTLLKRVTLIANSGVIEAVHYPIFPSNSDAEWVINYLKNNP
jgi:peroxiredoxin